MDEELFAGRYRILRRLGKGGMGQVYLVRDEAGGGGQVALKVLREDLELTSEAQVRFEREYDLLEGLSHPGIVRILDRGTWHGRYYFAMSYVPWPSLEQRLNERHGPRGRGFSTTDILSITRGLCDALQHMHDRGIVHRDLKPTNILVSDECETRLIDFGVARSLASELTRTGMILGSLTYLSPEQARGDRTVGPRSDIFAVGLLLYEMVTGRKAYTDATGYIQNVLKGEVPFSRLREVCPPAGPPLDAVVMKALSYDPNDRQESAQGLAQEVATALQPTVSTPPLSRERLSGGASFASEGVFNRLRGWFRRQGE